MKLRLIEIPEEGLHIEAESSKDAWFGGLVKDAFQEDFQGDHAASLDLRIQKTCENVSVNGSAEIDLTPVCDRCLEAFETHFRIPLHVDLAPYRDVGAEGEDEAALHQDDVNFSFYKGQEIDLGNILREMLLLEIPMQYLCSDSCKGLCPRCGVNLNLKSCSCVPVRGDPRFAVLKSLLKG